MNRSNYDKALAAVLCTEEVVCCMIHITEQMAQQVITESREAAHTLAHGVGKQSSELDSDGHQVRQRMIEEAHATARNMIRCSHEMARALFAEAHATVRASISRSTG